jgi:UDP-N-acetylmuramoyl-L-alanyl-D-glutamate--2,6-diaminopimelate ligase
MRLHDLLSPRLTTPPGLEALEIFGVEEDSRRVTPGTLFIARSGTTTDGARFLHDATARGAAAAIVQQPMPGLVLPQIVAPDPAALIAPLAHRFFGDPASDVKVLTVTGTNGKTTTAYLVRHLLAKQAIKCGMIGTVEIDDGATRREAAMTTPSPVDIARLMAAMRDNGCRACAIEVSSHALDQGRVAGIQIAAAAFTNLTGDHLDYHGTMDAYAAAKAKLFEMLPPGAPAIVNARDPYAPRMLAHTAGRPLRFSAIGDADYAATDAHITAKGSRFHLHTPRGEANISMRLIGRHNIENALTAAALVAESFDLTAAQIASALADAAGAPGRLQVVDAGQPYAVLVDYAHTHDALENVLTALRPLTQGRLRLLFGCGGDRDRTKRPKMAAVAQRLADDIFVTSDNPRTEDPRQIIEEILAGFSAEKRSQVQVSVDRREAIRDILATAAEGDVVLLAGKGHENYQILGTTKHHFDDVEEATRIITSGQ